MGERPVLKKTLRVLIIPGALQSHIHQGVAMLPRLAQSENATVTAGKTDSYVLLASTGDVRGVVERLKLKQRINATHSVRIAVV